MGIPCAYGQITLTLAWDAPGVVELFGAGSLPEQVQVLWSYHGPFGGQWKYWDDGFGIEAPAGGGYCPGQT